MDIRQLRHIVVEGPIGAGKTSLAKRLAHHLNADLMLEAPEQNPFLAGFYRERARYALPAQLFFLFQRIEQLRTLSQADLFARPVVGDFLLDKDPLFARMNLSDDELVLYQQIHDKLKPQAPVPDLVIALTARPDTLLARVARRGNGYESGISEAYLRPLCDAYTSTFHHYDAAPLLMINTEHLNPIDSEADFKLLLERVSAMRGRREIFNRSAA
jgi:deoxyadenosine/deoxycytidine kinase